MIAFAVVIVYGGAVLASNVLPRWVGWVSIIYSLGGLVHLAVTQTSYQVMQHAVLIVIGILLLVL